MISVFALGLAVFAQVSAEPAEPKREPWELSTPAEELKQLQGSWNVANVQHSAGVTRLLPKETGLAEEGTPLFIRGNELLRDGRVIATLANDLSTSGLDLKDIKPFRRPLLIILPDGRAILCAYDKRHLQTSVDIAYPADIGNVGAGQRVYLGRPTKKPVEQ